MVTILVNSPYKWKLLSSTLLKFAGEFGFLGRTPSCLDILTTADIKLASLSDFRIGLWVARLID